MSYRLERKIAGRGDGPRRFRSVLRGISLDADGLLYTVGDREVKVFKSTGEFLRRWTTARPGLSIAVTNDDRVLVGEPGRVEIFDTKGMLRSSLIDDDRLALVTSVTAHEDSIFAADARAPSIRHFDRNGKYVFSIGDGSRRRGFSVPGAYFDFSIDSHGDIHVAHNGKHRVEKYSAEGKLLGKFGHFGMRRSEDFRGCCNPTNITVGKSGNIVVAEKARPRVKVYDPEGALLSLIDAEHFDSACKYMDLAVDSDQRLYIADSVRATILVFAPVTTRASDRPGRAPAAQKPVSKKPAPQGAAHDG